ncbi:MAG: response regulator [Sedimentisphaerales bacterium]|nr:response regulator [Sedimentisphaerales bacterium]
MSKEFSILVAEDDDGHYSLIRKNLYRMGFRSKIIRFADGQETLDFLFRRGDGPHREKDRNYLLLLDIRMPKVDGIEVLRQVKGDPQLKSIPVIMLTTTDDDRAISQCRQLGCSDYVVKPLDNIHFMQAIHKVGLSLLLSVVEMSHLNEEETPL